MLLKSMVTIGFGLAAIVGCKSPDTANQVLSEQVSAAASQGNPVVKNVANQAFRLRVDAASAIGKGKWDNQSMIYLDLCEDLSIEIAQTTSCSKVDEMPVTEFIAQASRIFANRIKFKSEVEATEQASISKSQARFLTAALAALNVNANKEKVMKKLGVKKAPSREQISKVAAEYSDIIFEAFGFPLPVIEPILPFDPNIAEGAEGLNLVGSQKIYEQTWNFRPGQSVLPEVRFRSPVSGQQVVVSQSCSSTQVSLQLMVRTVEIPRLGTLKTVKTGEFSQTFQSGFAGRELNVTSILLSAASSTFAQCQITVTIGSKQISQPSRIAGYMLGEPWTQERCQSFNFVQPGLCLQSMLIGAPEYQDQCASDGWSFVQCPCIQLCSQNINWIPRDAFTLPAPR